MKKEDDQRGGMPGPPNADPLSVWVNVFICCSIWLVNALAFKILSPGRHVPTTSERFVERDEIHRHGALALDKLILRLIERAFGMKHVDEIRQAVRIELIGQPQGLLAVVHGFLKRAPAHLFLGVAHQSVFYILEG